MNQIKSSDFREEHLKLGNVWTWSSDIRDNEDSLVQVPLTEDALAEVDSLLISAVFETAQGDSLNGLVIYTMGSGSVFAIEILSGDLVFTFNKNARELGSVELRRLAAHLKRDANKLLPIKYRVLPVELAIPAASFSF
jgi:hypothetical protein